MSAMTCSDCGPMPAGGVEVARPTPTTGSTATEPRILRLLEVAMTARRMVEDGHPDDPSWFRIMSERLRTVADLTDAALMEGMEQVAASPSVTEPRGVPASVLMRVMCERCPHLREEHPDEATCNACLCSEFQWPDRVSVAASPSVTEPARCSGIVCIEGDCKRHSFDGELYCGEHGGAPEYVTDPGHPENPNGKIVVLPPDPVKDAAALLERWLYVGSMTRPDIDALTQSTEEWIREQAD